MAIETYNPSDFGDKEVALRNTFILQMYDARNYFLNVIRPRLDRAYKLYIAYTGDRQREIKRWQSNVFVPYVMAAVETLMPRILDARPDFTVRGRSSDDQMKTEKQQQLADYLWEISKMDSTAETLVRSSLIYGTGYLQVSWKKDVRKYKFLDTKDILEKKYTYKEKERVFYDAPFCEWIDNYQLWYDWHNTTRETKQYWFKRMVLSEPEIRRRYPNADKKRLQMALNGVGGDLNDYASVRNLVKSNHQFILKGFAPVTSYRGIGDDKFNVYGDPKLRMYEVFEWWRPFEDAYTVMVGNNYVPIFKGGVMPMPYDFKEAPFIEVPYLKMPYEFEGYGLPMILENPQIMLNLIKNQRLDAATLSIHKMWIVNPLANINKEELVTRPFGIIYSIDPGGVREVQFSDIKQSAYREEDLLKQDMRYSSGVDDASMAVGGGASSATEVRHLRESTLERVRLFVNHLGDAFSDVLRYWMDMQRQFFTKPMQIRVLGKDGEATFPLIEKDDLKGNFDYIATVIPSIAGQQDVKKKQDMDLFQLLINLPFIDPKKLTTKVLQDFGWNLDGITAAEQEAVPPEGQAPQVGPDGQPMAVAPEGAIPDMSAMMPPGAAPIPGGEGELPPGLNPNGIPPDVMIKALRLLGGKAQIPGGNSSQFSQANLPINLLTAGNPPTVPGVKESIGGGGPGPQRKRAIGKTTNLRGLNRSGALNLNSNSNPESELMKSTNNLQRKKL